MNEGFEEFGVQVINLNFWAKNKDLKYVTFLLEM
jgi:hypothetical protein